MAKWSINLHENHASPRYRWFTQWGHNIWLGSSMGRCARCGTKRPEEGWAPDVAIWVWNRTWYKPWTWFRGHWRLKRDVLAKAYTEGQLKDARPIESVE